jgi:Nucleotidyltransferase domain
LPGPAGGAAAAFLAGPWRCDSRTMRDEVAPLLNRFLAGLQEALPPTAVWVHGSLALGDFQPGRSDVDAIAVVDSVPAEDQREQLKVLHESLAAEFPQAKKLHCSYMVRATLPDARVRHLTWAHQELLTRPVTEVTRRELHTGDLALFGPPPSALLPPVSDEELAAFVRADLRDFWLPATAMPVRWLQDAWVDLGLLTLGRASVTLDDGRLVTKGEALDILPALGAPAEVLADVRSRRYGAPAPLSSAQRVRRARLTRAFVRSAIKRILSAPR